MKFRKAKEPKGETTVFYQVKIGYLALSFSSLEQAQRVYNILATTPFVTFSSTMIDEAVPEDKEEYRPYKNYHYLDGDNKKVSLETKEVQLYAKDEVVKFAKARGIELEKIDSKKKA